MGCIYVVSRLELKKKKKKKGGVGGGGVCDGLGDKRSSRQPLQGDDGEGETIAREPCDPPCLFPHH